MRLVMTLLVRDEEDIIDWHLRYHLARGVDHFVVTDNLSRDGTPDILRRYEQAGVLTYLREPSDDYSQDQWVTRMAGLAQARLDPAWLLHSDADEFWWPSGNTGLKEALARVPAEARAVHIGRHNYLGPARHGREPFFARMTWRQTVSTNYLGQPLPPKVAHRPVSDVFVHQGNHAISAGGEAVTHWDTDAVSIFHFPARSPEQLRGKIAHGGAAYARNERFGAEVGGTWRSMYREMMAGRFDRVVERHFLTVPPADATSELVEDVRLRDFMARL